MSTPKNQRRILAQKIADALMKPHYKSFEGVEFESARLQIKLQKRKWDVQSEIDGGGWCREAAIDQIERVLKEEHTLCTTH